MREARGAVWRRGWDAAAAVAFYKYANDEKFETNSVPSNIVSFLTESSPYDIVVIDTVSSISACQKSDPTNMVPIFAYSLITIVIVAVLFLALYLVEKKLKITSKI